MYDSALVNGKKNQRTAILTATPACRPIRLKPSASDYSTSARTTADAMNLSGPPASKTKPVTRVLSLTGLAS